MGQLRQFLRHKHIRFYRLKVISFVVILVATAVCLMSTGQETDKMYSYVVDPQQETIAFFHKDDEGMTFKNFSQLKLDLAKKGKTMVFGMNGGMFQKDFSPLGLYVEEGKTLHTINRTEDAYGNFYLQPNGVFYITKNREAFVCSSKAYKENEKVLYASQSGPMLVIDGVIHSAFRPQSSSLYIRNGVGVLPDGQLLFAMSKEPVNFYEFANYFLSHGCQNALYLDGFVSRMYMPTKGLYGLDGQFGIIIAVIKDE